MLSSIHHNQPLVHTTPLKNSSKASKFKQSIVNKIKSIFESIGKFFSSIGLFFVNGYKKIKENKKIKNLTSAANKDKLNSTTSTSLQAPSLGSVKIHGIDLNAIDIHALVGSDKMFSFPSDCFKSVTPSSLLEMDYYFPFPFKKIFGEKDVLQKKLDLAKQAGQSLTCFSLNPFEGGINNKQLEDLIKACPNLKRIRIDLGALLTDLKCLSALTHLEEITLGFLPKLDTQEIQFLKNLKNLKKISLNIFKLKDEDLNNLPNGIVELNLENTYSLTDAIMTKIPKSVIKLKLNNLSITDKAFDYPLPDNLKQLELVHCISIKKNAFFSSAFIANQTLSTLTLKNCSFFWSEYSDHPIKFKKELASKKPLLNISIVIN